MLRTLPAWIGFTLVVAFGVAEGLWANRWQTSEAAERAAAALAEVPLSVGDWQGEARELDARQSAHAEITGHLWRRYVNRRTGAEVTVLLVCGRAGPVALHPPEVCYGGAGYHLAGEKVRHAVAAEALGAPAEFWAGQFQKDGAVPQPLRILWAWSADGRWVAADSPRLSFARSPALYKLYVVREMPRADEPLANDPCPEFLKAFLPQLNGRLFPAAG
jgi:hypothetical protein